MRKKDRRLTPGPSAPLPASGYARLQKERSPPPPSLIYPLAAAGQLRVGVHDAPVVRSLASADPVVGIAVADVDLVAAEAGPDYVVVVTVLVGEDEVVPPWR
jgi:hypothetical protein